MIGPNPLNYNLATGVFEISAERLRFSVHLGPENRNVLTGALESRSA